MWLILLSLSLNLKANIILKEKLSQITLIGSPEIIDNKSKNLRLDHIREASIIDLRERAYSKEGAIYFLYLAVSALR